VVDTASLTAMKTRTTIILAVVALALYLFVRFFQAPTTREAAEQEDNVVQIDREQIDGVVIESGERKIELAKQDGRWRIRKPVDDLADSNAIDQLLSGIELLRSESTLKLGHDSKDRLKEYGLAEPAFRVKLRGKDAPSDLLFGADTAVEGKSYMRIKGAGEVYVVSNSLKEELSKNPDDFRDRSLTDISVHQVDRVVIKKPSGQIELKKEGDHWQIEKPLKTRGDDSRINDLIAQTLTTRIESFVTQQKEPGQYGLSEPSGTVQFYTEQQQKPVELQLGAEVDKDKIYARLSTRDSIHIVPKKAKDVVDVNPNDLRDKKLVRIEMDIVDRVAIKGAGAELLLIREGEEWKINGNMPGNEAMVKQLVNALEGAQITRFVADSASELQKFGLKNPSVTVRFSSYASENTAETQAGEQPVAIITFGKTEGEEVYARVEEEPYIVAVNKSLLHSIPLDPSQWRSLTVFSFEPTEIKSLSREKYLPISLKRTDSKWRASAGEVREENVQSLLNTLCSLKAVRWAGATTKEHSFNNPTVKLSFETEDGEKAQLIVGQPTPQGMYYAAVGKADAAFEMNKPDLSALQLPLTKEQDTATKPQPSPAVQQQSENSERK
jgi:Domain of unknown function (DUF4340)